VQAVPENETVIAPVFSENERRGNAYKGELSNIPEPPKTNDLIKSRLLILITVYLLLYFEHEK
jgi:hypothetical protein